MWKPNRMCRKHLRQDCTISWMYFSPYTYSIRTARAAVESRCEQPSVAPVRQRYTWHDDLLPQKKFILPHPATSSAGIMIQETGTVADNPRRFLPSLFSAELQRRTCADFSTVVMLPVRRRRGMPATSEIALPGMRVCLSTVQAVEYQPIGSTFFQQEAIPPAQRSPLGLRRRPLCRDKR